MKPSKSYNFKAEFRIISYKTLEWTPPAEKLAL